jgi:hypothetical protein
MTPMSDVEQTEENVPRGYMREDTYRKLRGGISERTARRERQLGAAPPYVQWGNLIIYSEAGFAAFLQAREVHPVRSLGRPLGRKTAAVEDHRKRGRPEVAERRERVAGPRRIADPVNS